MEHVFKPVDIKFLVAFEYDKVMPVAFVVAEEQVLAMGGVYVFPVFQCLFYCRQRRVCEQFVTDAVGRKKVQCLAASCKPFLRFIFRQASRDPFRVGQYCRHCHLERLFA